ncbi:MAG: hypothetical protein II707_07500 [Spirochaetales bacterium]|nr:hypothetical protein [Spirochaetales bacterium]
MSKSFTSRELMNKTFLTKEPMMVKKARPRNPKRIKDLKDKINDEAYLNKAIGRIAMLLSEEILGQ